MSSTVTNSEAQMFNHRPTTTFHPSKNTKKLVRTTSLEKIRRFNSFICSQHYYVIPAILAWLRFSQSSLQSAADKTILAFRYVILGQLFRLKKKISPMKVAVYSIALILLGQLALCVYLLVQTSSPPSGLIFLVVCWMYINYLHFTTTFFYVSKTSMKKIH